MDRFLLLVRYFHRKIMKQQDRSIFDISSSNWIAMMIRVQKRQDVSQLNYLKQFISYANILPDLSWQTSVCWGADVLLLLLPLFSQHPLPGFHHDCHAATYGLLTSMPLASNTHSIYYFSQTKGVGVKTHNGIGTISTCGFYIFISFCCRPIAIRWLIFHHTLAPPVTVTVLTNRWVEAKAWIECNVIVRRPSSVTIVKRTWSASLSSPIINSRCGRNGR